MLVTADALRPYLGRTWFLLFLGLELARRRKQVLFVSSSVWTDDLLGLDSLRGQETLLLERDYWGSMPNLMDYVHEPYPGFCYLGAPRTRRMENDDVRTICTDSGYDVVICQYRSTPGSVGYCLVPDNLQFLRNNEAAAVWHRACRPVVSGVPEELLTRERREMYASLLGPDVRFVRWDARLSLVPCERELLDYFRNEPSSGYLEDIRQVADDLAPCEEVRETVGPRRLWKRWVDKRHDE